MGRLIDTVRGKVDEDDLDVALSKVDDEKYFGTVVTYRFKSDGVVAAAYLRNGFVKNNQFDHPDDPDADVLIEIDGVRSTRKSRELVRVIGSHDDEVEYTTWVEYYLEGREKHVHRSVCVTLKKPAVEASGDVGNLSP